MYSSLPICKKSILVAIHDWTWPVGKEDYLIFAGQCVVVEALDDKDRNFVWCYKSGVIAELYMWERDRPLPDDLDHKGDPWVVPLRYFCHKDAWQQVITLRNRPIGATQL